MNTKYPAKFIGKTFDEKRRAVLIYEYKGVTYAVTDPGWNQPLGGSLYQQHQEEQRQIDDMLLRPKADPTDRGTNDSELAFNKLFNYFETGEWEE